MKDNLKLSLLNDDYIVHDNNTPVASARNWRTPMPCADSTWVSTSPKRLLSASTVLIGVEPAQEQAKTKFLLSSLFYIKNKENILIIAYFIVPLQKVF